MSWRSAQTDTSPMDRFGLTENERDDDTESRDVEKHAQDVLYDYCEVFPP